MRDDLCREAGHQWVCHFDHNRCMACGTVQGIEATAADKPTVSDEAVEAAVTAYFGKHDGDYISDGQRHLMRAALAAAQPLMVADAVAGERERITAAIEAEAEKFRHRATSSDNYWPKNMRRGFAYRYDVPLWREVHDLHIVTVGERVRCEVNDDTDNAMELTVSDSMDGWRVQGLFRGSGPLARYYTATVRDRADSLGEGL